MHQVGEERAAQVPWESLAPARDEIAALFLAGEADLVSTLRDKAAAPPGERPRIAELAGRLVRAARANRHEHGGVDAFMHEYGLTSEEGVILMCLAEALLRIPDKDTADALISEKIGEGQWEKHLGASDSLFVNASTFGLMLTGRLVRLAGDRGAGPAGILKRLVARSGEPLIRQALRQAMKILGDNFVLGRTIKEALARAVPYEAKGYRFSYDMLGERAKTAADAERYFGRYMAAIATIGAAKGPPPRDCDGLMARPGVSVKLSAIHPRFEPGKEARHRRELLPRLIALAAAARAQGLGLTVDAEEQDRLDLTLGLFAAAFCAPALEGWPAFGLAVQAYGKRAMPLLAWLRRLAHQQGKPILVRLVKGAYWDSEIKWAQERGIADYPVFTRKGHTDASYLACMRELLADPGVFFPQFATHNAHTIASVYTAAGGLPFEFQRLHGMGEALYGEVVGGAKLDVPCRVYAPVGPYEDLVSYLVRRLLENGANTSFVNRLADEAAPIEDIIRDPVESLPPAGEAAIARLPRPPEIYGAQRRNSAGLALSEPSVRGELLKKVVGELERFYAAAPIVGGRLLTGPDAVELVFSPHDRQHRVGTVRTADGTAIEAAIAGACASAAA